MVAGGARGSWIGAIFGAFLGDWIENRFFSKSRHPKRTRIFKEPFFQEDPLSNAYELLGVRADAPYEVVHAAYREFAKKYHPDAMAVEELFFTNNKTTGIDVAQARGVILLAAKQNNIPFYEYTPLQVKQALTRFMMVHQKSMTVHSSVVQVLQWLKFLIA